MTSMFVRRNKNEFSYAKTARKFANDKENIQRIKHLRTIIDHVSTSELKSFFASNYSLIYFAFYDVFVNVEADLKQKVNFAHRKELDSILVVFEKILVLLPDKIEKRWQYNCICRLIQKLLHPGNSIVIRHKGIRLFLLWYQILNENATDLCHNMFINLVPEFSSLIQENLHSEKSTDCVTDPSSCDKGALKSNTGGANSSPSESGLSPDNIPFPLLCAANSTSYLNGPVTSVEIAHILPPTSSEKDEEVNDFSHNLLRYMLRFMVTEIVKVEWNEKNVEKRQEAFFFLFEQFKKHYLPVLFPKLDRDYSIYEPKLEFLTTEQLSNYSSAPSDYPIPPSRLNMYQEEVIRWVAEFVYTEQKTDHPSRYDRRNALMKVTNQDSPNSSFFVRIPSDLRASIQTDSSSSALLPESVAASQPRFSMAPEFASHIHSVNSSPQHNSADIDSLGGTRHHLDYASVGSGDQMSIGTSSQTNTLTRSSAAGHSHGASNRGECFFISFENVPELEYTVDMWDIVRSILLSCRENINLINSLFRAAFLLPIDRHIAQSAVICVYRSWLFNKNKRPIFMMEPEDPTDKEHADPYTVHTTCKHSDSQLTLSRGSTHRDSIDSSSNTACSHCQSLRAGLQNIEQIIFTNVSLVYLHSSSVPHPNGSTNYLSEQIDLCRYVMKTIYRGCILNQAFEFQVETWETLLNVLLHIVRVSLSGKSPDEEHKDHWVSTKGITGPLFQTLNAGFLWSNLNAAISTKIWDQFLEVYSKFNHWSYLIEEWSKTITYLTKFMSKYLYGVDLDDPPLEKKEKKGRRLQSKSRSHDRTKQRSSHRTDNSMYHLNDSLSSSKLEKDLRQLVSSVQQPQTPQAIAPGSLSATSTPSMPILSMSGAGISQPLLSDTSSFSANSSSLNNSNQGPDSSSQQHLLSPDNDSFSSSIIQGASNEILTDMTSLSGQPELRIHADRRVSNDKMFGSPVGGQDIFGVEHDRGSITSSHGESSSYASAEESAPGPRGRLRKKSGGRAGQFDNLPYSDIEFGRELENSPEKDECENENQLMLSQPGVNPSSSHSLSHSPLMSSQLDNASLNNETRSAEEEDEDDDEDEDEDDDDEDVMKKMCAQISHEESPSDNILNKTATLTKDNNAGSTTVVPMSSSPNTKLVQHVTVTDARSHNVNNQKRTSEILAMNAETSEIIDNLPGQVEGSTDEASSNPAVSWEQLNDPVNRSYIAGGKMCGWTAEASVLLWQRFLGILGDINSVSNPERLCYIHTILSNLTETLIKIRENQAVSLDNQSTPLPPHFIPPVNFIVPWLFNALSLSEKFNATRLIALQTLCQIAAHQRDLQPQMDFLTLLYRELHLNLNSDDEEFVSQVIRCCGPQFFSHNLPGSNLLVMDFINGCNRVISSRGIKGTPRKEAISILGSLLCFTHHFGELQVLQPKEKKMISTLCVDLQDQLISSLLHAALQEPSLQARCIAVSCVGLYLYEMLTHPPLNSSSGRPVIKAPTIDADSAPTLAALSGKLSQQQVQQSDLTLREAVIVLLAMLRFHDLTVALVAVDMVRLLTDHVAMLLDRLPDIPTKIIHTTAWTLNYLMEKFGTKPISRIEKQLITGLIFCLVDWCITLPVHLLLDSADCDSKGLIHLTFTVLHNISTYSASSSNRSSTSNANLLNMSNSGSMFYQGRVDGSFQDPLIDANLDVKNVTEIDSQAMLHIEEASRSPAHSSHYPSMTNIQTVKLAAKVALCHLLNHLGHFPMSSDASRLNSSIQEYHDFESTSSGSAGSGFTDFSSQLFDEPNLQFFAVNSSMLVTLMTVPVTVSSIEGNPRQDRQNTINSAISDIVGSYKEAGELEKLPDVVSRDSISGPMATSSSMTSDLIAGRHILRIIVRDVTGKYSWDCCPLYATPSNNRSSYSDAEDPPPPSPPPRLTAPSTQSRVSCGEPEIKVFESERVVFHNVSEHKCDNPEVVDTYEGETNGSDDYADDLNDVPAPNIPPPTAPSLLRPPIAATATDNGQNTPPDKLNQLMIKLCETSPECRLESGSGGLAQPTLHPDQPSGNLEEVAISQVNAQSLVEDQVMSSPKMNEPCNCAPQVLPSSFHDPSSSFYYCRHLLSQLGFLSWERRSSIELLSKSQNLIRELKNLDTRVRSRETHKIAVLYIAKGQEDKLSILSNSSGSLEYENFVAGLGWEVELSSHAGFSGGLESSGRTGISAPYYANSTMEIIYHVATRMPSASEEDRHRKTKHLGNDSVMIVWSEHYREFRRHIIKTEFGDAIIIIYPLPNGLFKIEIQRKLGIPFFGPLFDGAIVDERVLPGLVRATAINASRVTRLISVKPVYMPFYEERASYLHGIISNCSEVTCFEDFAQNVFAPVFPPDGTLPNTPTDAPQWILQTKEHNFEKSGDPATKPGKGDDTIFSFDNAHSFVSSHSRSPSNQEHGCDQQSANHLSPPHHEHTGTSNFIRKLSMKNKNKQMVPPKTK